MNKVAIERIGIILSPGTIHILDCPICRKTSAAGLKISKNNKKAQYLWHCEHYKTDRAELLYNEEYVYWPVYHKNNWGVITEAKKS